MKNQPTWVISKADKGNGPLSHSIFRLKLFRVFYLAKLSLIMYLIRKDVSSNILS